MKPQKILLPALFSGVLCGTLVPTLSQAEGFQQEPLPIGWCNFRGYFDDEGNLIPAPLNPLFSEPVDQYRPPLEVKILKDGTKIAILSEAPPVVEEDLITWKSRRGDGATFALQIADSANEGFNDPTPVSPVGGNTGTTLGEQRRIALQAAADEWGKFLDSNVTIIISVTMDPLPCGDGGATLGSAGPLFLANSAPELELNEWYAGPLANAIVGRDIAPMSVDIQATFSGNLDLGCLPGQAGFYYGLDRNSPFNQVDFFEVTLHELGHGLGFVGLVDAFFSGSTLSSVELASGIPDQFIPFMQDGDTGKFWDDMTDAERTASAQNADSVYWTGSNARDNAEGLIVGTDSFGRIEMFTPNPFQSGSSVSHWNRALFPDEVMEPSATNGGAVIGGSPTLGAMEDMGWPVVEELILLQDDWRIF